MDDELELQQAAEREDNPDQAALMTLAVEVEAGNASSEDLASLAEEVEEKSWFEQFWDEIQEKGFIGAIFSLFVNEPTSEESPETTEPDPEIRIVNTNPYTILPEELAGYNENEQRSLRIIAQAGISPEKINQLFAEVQNRNVNREQFLDYSATIIMHCSNFAVPVDKMFPLVLATMCTESNFDRGAYNSSGATGILQHINRFWPDREARLRERGVLVEGRPNSPAIYNTSNQIAATIQYYIDSFRSLGDINSYSHETLSRDAYLTYNGGAGHAWLSQSGVLGWDIGRIRSELLTMTEAQRIERFGSNADTFSSYMPDRLIEPFRRSGMNVYDYTQKKYEQYRHILCDNSQVNV